MGKTDRMRASRSRGLASGRPLAVPVALTLALALVAAFWSGPATAAPDQPLAMVRLVGAGTSVPSGATVVGPTDPASTVQAEVVLRPRDPAALDAFVRSVSTPGTPQFRRYLRRGQFGAVFGPDAATVTATRDWLSSTGLVVGPTASDGLFIPVSGPAAEMERTFSVPLVQARLRTGSVTRVGLGNPEVPAALARGIQGVIGLSDASLLHPQIVLGRGGASAGAAPAAASPRLGSRPSQVGPSPCAEASAVAGAYGGWTANQLASTYGLSTLYGEGRSAAGQTVGIYELESYQASDIQTYESCYGLGVPVTDVTVDGGAGPPIEDGEAALDIEMVAGLAPSSSVLVYTGPQGGTGPIDTYRAMVDDDAAKVLSTSWGECEPDMDPTDQSAETALFAQAATQGQTVLAASGDSGSSDCYDVQMQSGSHNLAVDDPADQPDVTGVGGTSLTAANPNAPTESVWNDGTSGAGGGGNSTVFPAPMYQQVPGAEISDTVRTCGPHSNEQCREIPDVAASADPGHGVVIFMDGVWVPVGGTSAAAPLWAALVADTNQGCSTPAGLLGPELYQSGAASSVNDITSGSNSIFVAGDFPARVGYDLASGWGSPRAASLLGLFSGSAAGCPAVTGLSPSSGKASGGQTVVVSGSGFGTGAPTVRFGGANATVVAHTPTAVTVTTPDVVTGQQSAVTVTTTTGPAAGTSAAVPSSIFTFISPRVSSVIPIKGPTTGGGRVTIAGSDFGGATSVRFGTNPAAFTVTSAGSIVATVPAGPGGGATVDVSVSSPDGTSPEVSADRYIYALPGYWLVASDGGIFDFGHAGFYGSTGNLILNRPVVGMAATPDGKGYWLVASDGGIFAYGDAGFYGSTGNLILNQPVVGMAATPDGKGYWLVASDGGIFAFGDAAFHGSTGNLVLNRPVVGMAATPDGKGYWLVASDGGIFAFGDAAFHGSTGGTTLNRPVVGMAATPDGKGYWLVASDGGIFAFGDAGFYGSTGNLILNRPVVGMAPSLTGKGYWLVASDGGIFAYGDARFFGSTGGITLNRPVVGMTST